MQINSKLTFLGQIFTFLYFYKIQDLRLIHGFLLHRPPFYKILEGFILRASPLSFIDDKNAENCENIELYVETACEPIVQSHSAWSNQWKLHLSYQQKTSME